MANLAANLVLYIPIFLGVALIIWLIIAGQIEKRRTRELLELKARLREMNSSAAGPVGNEISVARNAFAAAIFRFARWPFVLTAVLFLLGLWLVFFKGHSQSNPGRRISPARQQLVSDGVRGQEMDESLKSVAPLPMVNLSFRYRAPEGNDSELPNRLSLDWHSGMQDPLNFEPGTAASTRTNAVGTSAALWPSANEDFRVHPDESPQIPSDVSWR